MKTFNFKLILDVKAEGVDKVDALHRLEDKFQQFITCFVSLFIVTEQVNELFELFSCDEEIS